MSVLRADPHARGPGKVHAFDPAEGRTRCGKYLAACPGTVEEDGDVTCRGCLNAVEADERREQWRAEHEAQRAEWEARRERESREWWERYDAYLLSEAWRERRRRVLKRDGGICQGCLTEPAVMVHHLTYEHVRSELLWELVAICRACHDYVHGAP